MKKKWVELLTELLPQYLNDMTRLLYSYLYTCTSCIFVHKFMLLYLCLMQYTVDPPRALHGFFKCLYFSPSYSTSFFKNSRVLCVTLWYLCYDSEIILIGRRAVDMTLH
jgi:hypothetical protein